MNSDELKCGESRYYNTGDDVGELRDKYNLLVEVVLEQEATLDVLCESLTMLNDTIESLNETNQLIMETLKKLGRLERNEN